MYYEETMTDDVLDDCGIHPTNDTPPIWMCDGFGSEACYLCPFSDMVYESAEGADTDTDETDGIPF